MAQLHLEMLSEQRTQNAVRAALENLPSSLDETYKDVIKRIQKQAEADVDLALKVLSWITYAKRPLHKKELQHAVTTHRDLTTLDDADLTDIDDLISLCAGIVTIDRESDIVRLVHYTTQQYLETELIELKITVVARGCLDYLGLEVFCTIATFWDRVLERIEEYPLLPYAVRYWADHLRGEPENELRTVWFRVFTRQGLCDSVSQINRMYALDVTSGLDETFVIENSLLHVLAESGLVVLCRHLLDTGFSSSEMYLPNNVLNLIELDSFKPSGL